jgi:hypothetical protein
MNVKHLRHQEGTVACYQEMCRDVHQWSVHLNRSCSLDIYTVMYATPV